MRAVVLTPLDSFATARAGAIRDDAHYRQHGEHRQPDEDQQDQDLERSHSATRLLGASHLGAVTRPANARACWSKRRR